MLKKSRLHPNDFKPIDSVAMELYRHLSDSPDYKCMALEYRPAAVKILKHYLDQVSDKGFFKTEPIVESVAVQNPLTEKVSEKKLAKKTRLDTTISFSEISDIDPMNGCFHTKIRLYLVWMVDLQPIGFEEVANKALKSGHFYSMTEDEIKLLADVLPIPVVSIFNAIESEEADTSIRVYGGKPGMTALMWNQEFKVKCREVFELHDFPFDTQELQVELRLNDSKTWDLYDLTVNNVQFHKNAIVQNEWQLDEPFVQRGSPANKCSTVKVIVSRYSAYYIQNIILTMSTLSLLGLLSFAMDASDISSRVGTILQLILTAVAFKFILAQSLPKVPYNTSIDFYVMSSYVTLAFTALFATIPGYTQNPNYYNFLMLYVSVAFLGATQIIWIGYWMKANFFGIERIPLKPVDGKNWYCFRFCTPPFLGEAN